MRLALSNFGELVSVFKGRHKFNRSIRNTGKDMLESSPREEIQRYCQGKFLSNGNIQRDVLFAENVVLCYRCKTRYMLGKNCPVITPTQKDSWMSFTERSATPSRNPSPRQLDHSAEILPCVEPLQQPSTPTKDVVRGNHSGEVSDWDSDSESDSKSCSDSDLHNECKSRSEHSSEKFGNSLGISIISYIF